MSRSKESHLTTSLSLKDKIIIYYDLTAPAYRNWGECSGRKGIYALHSGFYPEGIKTDHRQSVLNMTQKIIDLTQVWSGQTILDAGCGTGEVVFEIASQFPNVQVWGINIVPRQLTTAQDFKEREGIKNVNFALQDYMRTGFAANTFERVIFCESFAHASDKKVLMEETKRILKPKGRVAVADLFLTPDKLTSEQEILLSDFQEGWLVPNVVQLDTLVSWLTSLGFKNIISTEATKNVTPSSERMMRNAALRLKEGVEAPEIVTKSRKACVAQYSLLKNGVLSYHFISFEIVKE